MGNSGSNSGETVAKLGFEAKLWQMVDGHRNNTSAAEYKHVGPDRSFLSCISDAFEAKHAEIKSQREQGAM